jgi:hypothetical protein
VEWSIIFFTTSALLTPFGIEGAPAIKEHSSQRNGWPETRASSNAAC